jgi:hypothetical protein
MIPDRQVVRHGLAVRPACHRSMVSDPKMREPGIFARRPGVAVPSHRLQGVVIPTLWRGSMP